MAALIAVVFFLVLLPAAAVLDGFALRTLWGWFIVPLGLPGITTAHAIGLAVVASALIRIDTRSDESEGAWWVPLLKILLRPAFAVFFGWIVHGAM